MSGARFYLTPQGQQAMQRLQRLPTAADTGVRKGLSAWALKIKTEANRATPGRAGRGLRFTDPRKRLGRWQVEFQLRFKSAWWEMGTRAHRILPRGLGRARVSGQQHTVGRGRNSRSKVLIVPRAAGTRSRYSTARGRGGGREGLRRWVAHPGTRPHWTVRKTITARADMGRQIINEHIMREFKR